MSRREYGEGSIHFDHRGTECRDARFHRTCTGRWAGVVSLGTVGGKRVRQKVSGQTRTAVKARLDALRAETDSGVRTSATYTVRQCVDEFLKDGLDGRSERTRSTYREAIEPVLSEVGARPLRDLTATDVRTALVAIARTRSSRSVAIAHNVLTRAVNRAAAHDRVSRNVAALAEQQAGKKDGRTSKAMTRDVLRQLLAVAETDDRIGAYLIVSVMTGCRPEEIRALRWDHVLGLDGDQPSIAVWRSTRQHGDVKTVKSRRTLAIPGQAAEALQRRQAQQDAERQAAGSAWHETGLVFTTSVGTELDSHNVRRSMRKLTKAAGLGENWTPRELRHTFVSILSEAEVPLEEIARLAGHSTTRTTELVYRKELRPVLQTGATVMGSLMA